MSTAANECEKKVEGCASNTSKEEGASVFKDVTGYIDWIAQLYDTKKHSLPEEVEEAFEEWVSAMS